MQGKLLSTVNGWIISRAEERMAKERCIMGILCSLKNVKSDSTSCSKLYDFRSSTEHKSAKGDLSIECFVALKSHLCQSRTNR